MPKALNKRDARSHMLTRDATFLSSLEVSADVAVMSDTMFCFCLSLMQVVPYCKGGLERVVPNPQRCQPLAMCCLGPRPLDQRRLVDAS